MHYGHWYPAPLVYLFSYTLSFSLEILIYFLAFLPYVTPSPAAANGPRGFIFGMRIDLAANSTLFDKSRS